VNECKVASLKGDRFSFDRSIKMIIDEIKRVCESKFQKQPFHKSDQIAYAT
jgi:hypothetical protein